MSDYFIKEQVAKSKLCIEYSEEYIQALQEICPHIETNVIYHNPSFRWRHRQCTVCDFIIKESYDAFEQYRREVK